MRKPCPLHQPHDKLRARVAKNFLLVTLMSLNAGYGPLIERCQQQTNDAGLSPPLVSPVALSDEQVRDRYLEQGEQEQGEKIRSSPAGLPPETLLARHLREVKTSNSAVAVVKDSDLKDVARCVSQAVSQRRSC